MSKGQWRKLRKGSVILMARTGRPRKIRNVTRHDRKKVFVTLSPLLGYSWTGKNYTVYTIGERWMFTK